MSTYFFELLGVTDANLPAVTAALANVPGCACRVIRTAMGQYLVSVTTDLSEDDALDALNAVLAPLGVRAVKTLAVKPVVVGPKF